MDLLFDSNLPDLINQDYIDDKDCLNQLNELGSELDNDDNKHIDAISEEDIKIPNRSSRYKCEICDMSYSKRRYLSNHMGREHSLTLESKIGRPREPQLPITVDNPRPYKCDICVKE